MDLIFLPLAWLADWLVIDVLGLTAGDYFTEALRFFVYDTPKIFILLAVMVFAVSYLRTYLPPSRVRWFLSGRNKFLSYILSAAFGVITPFCTCSAIPLFIGFVQAGVPLGATFAFLVASPMVNEIALALLWATFGFKIALLYALFGLTIAVVSGWLISFFDPKSLISQEIQPAEKIENTASQTQKQRLVYAKDYCLNIIGKVWLWLIVGVGIGAFIHGYVPADLINQIAGSSAWYGVPLAVLLGVPIYSNAAGLIPLVSALWAKGAAVGTVMAFMMACIGLSLPEFIILKKIMKPKLIAIFAGIVSSGIVIVGYLFNLFANLGWL